MNELDVALAVASGESPSPTHFGNSDYVALRVSGSGVAYRPSLGEYVFRDPVMWTSPTMIRRAVGMAVVVEHPAGSIMTSRCFGDRCVGVIVHSYVKDAELWGIARIIDSEACRLISEGMFDTSPSVVFGDEAGAYIEVDDGGRMLVEGEPTFFDHLALVYTGEGNTCLHGRGK